MNIGYLNKLMYTFKMDIINHLPITRWDFDGIFEYIKKNHEREYYELVSDSKKANKLSAKEFCQNILWMSSEPKEKFILFYEKALSDLNKIDKNLNLIEEGINNLKSIKNQYKMLNINQRYELKKLEYFKEKNNKAKEEVINFISSTIKYYSYEKCINSPMGNSIIKLIEGDMPYSFSKGTILEHKDFYNPNSLTDLSNKFLDFYLDEHIQLEELYKRPEYKDQFLDISKRYLYGKLPRFPEPNKLQKLKNIIENNHIINRRKDILYKIIEAFENKEFLLVINILPLQIEGIFHDICQAYGIEEHLLSISSINNKLELLRKKSINFYLFEYYSFKFPITRNQVAHGELVSGELELKATMLILDLIPVAEMSLDEMIPINKKLKLIKNILDSNDLNSLLDIFKYNLLDIKIPEFYNIDDNYLSLCDSNDFFEKIRNKIKSEKLYLPNNKDKLKKLMKIVSQLENHNIATHRVESFRKELNSLLKKYNEEDNAGKNLKILDL